MNYGRAIRMVREGQGMTQSELSRQTKLMRTYLVAIETGSRKVGLRGLGKIAAKLQTTVCALTALATEAKDIQGAAPAERSETTTYCSRLTMLFSSKNSK